LLNPVCGLLDSELRETCFGVVVEDDEERLWEGEEVVSTCSGTGEDGARIGSSEDGNSSSIE
jgi:hypothetical protein